MAGGEPFDLGTLWHTLGLSLFFRHTHHPIFVRKKRYAPSATTGPYFGTCNRLRVRGCGAARSVFRHNVLAFAFFRHRHHPIFVRKKRYAPNATTGPYFGTCNRLFRIWGTEAKGGMQKKYNFLVFPYMIYSNVGFPLGPGGIYSPL